MKRTSNQRKNFRSLIAVLVFIFIVAGCDKFPVDSLPGPGHGNSTDATKQSATIAHDWYRLQLSILLERNSAFNGVHFAFIGVGLYESVRNGIKQGKSFSSVLNGMPGMPSVDKEKSYNWEASANAALAAMVRNLYQGLTPANFKTIDSLENTWQQKFQATVSPHTLLRSADYGKQIAAAIIAWYQQDNFNPSNTGFVPKSFEGAWEPTPPAFANGVNPYIASATTFVAAHTTLISPPFPFPYSVVPGSGYYNMVRQLYEVSASLNDEQKAIALYWVDQGNGIGLTPAGHDFAIVMQALEQNGFSLATAAEVYAKAGIAERDATIVTFRSKYEYNVMRPVTYIQKNGLKDWLPFIVTPPHPEYPAAHALVTGSVMKAVASVIGTHTTVTDRIYSFRGFPEKKFSGLFKAAEEAGISRLYGGIHYLPSIDEGLRLAKIIGDNTGKLKLK